MKQKKFKVKNPSALASVNPKPIESFYCDCNNPTRAGLLGDKCGKCRKYVSKWITNINK